MPAFELGEVLAELLAVFIGGEVHTRVLVELVDELDAEVYHLLHGAVLREVAIGEAILAVVGVVARDLVGEGHAAALAEMLIFGEGVIHRCCLFLLIFYVLLLACGERNLVNLVNLRLRDMRCVRK